MSHSKKNSINFGTQINENLIVLDNKLLAIKAEFEAEGTTIDELAILSQFCRTNKIPLTLKIGGAIAQRDIYEAIQLGAQNILAPMIESKFALNYFTRIYKNVSKSFERLNYRPYLYINIESELAYKRIDEILGSIESSNKNISGIVIGRSDLSESINEKNVNSNKIYEMAFDILTKAKKINLDVTIGGTITKESYQFINSLANHGLNAFETRKCTFLVENSLSQSYFNKLVDFGLYFELQWLEYKKNIYVDRSINDDMRIVSLNRSLNIDDI